jgi:hypothetical protein
MQYDWGPHYIVPTAVIKIYSGQVVLREEYDSDLLAKELKDFNFSRNVERVNNPWYFRKKGTSTWIKIGESSNQSDNFSVRWDTKSIANGKYEVLGLMHVSVGKGSEERTIARQNVVEVTVEN